MIELTFLKKLTLIRVRYFSLLLFLNKSLKFQSNFCNGYHDLLMVSMILTDIAILNIKSAAFCCIISVIIKSEAINLLQNADFTRKKIGTVMMSKLNACIL